MFMTARRKGMQPSWVREQIWEELCQMWATPEYWRKVFMTKQNRGIESVKGAKIHIGGSIPHTEYWKKLTQDLSREPLTTKFVLKPGLKKLWRTGAGILVAQFLQRIGAPGRGGAHCPSAGAPLVRCRGASFGARFSHAECCCSISLHISADLT